MYNDGVIVMLFFEAKVYKFKSCAQIYVWTAPLFAGTNSTYVILWLFGSEMGNDLAGFLAFWQPAKSLHCNKTKLLPGAPKPLKSPFLVKNLFVPCVEK